MFVSGINILNQRYTNNAAVSFGKLAPAPEAQKLPPFVTHPKKLFEYLKGFYWSIDQENWNRLEPFWAEKAIYNREVVGRHKVLSRTGRNRIMHFYRNQRQLHGKHTQLKSVGSPLIWPSENKIRLVIQGKFVGQEIDRDVHYKFMDVLTLEGDQTSPYSFPTKIVARLSCIADIADDIVLPAEKINLPKAELFNTARTRRKSIPAHASQRRRLQA